MGNLFGNPNSAMVSNAFDVYGYEPAVMGRYAELMKRMQNQPPDDGEAEIILSPSNRLIGLLRCRLLIAPDTNGQPQYSLPIDAAPQVLLSDRYEIQTSPRRRLRRHAVAGRNNRGESHSGNRPESRACRRNGQRNGASGGADNGQRDD